MITDNDVKKLLGAMEGVFATKNDLHTVVSRLDKKFLTKDHFEAKYDKLFTLLDGVAKRVRDIWEELSLTQNRVVKLEKFREGMRI